MKYLHITPPWYVFYGQGQLCQPMVPLGAAGLARSAMRVGWNARIWNGDLESAGKVNQFNEEMAAYESYLENYGNPAHPAWSYLREFLRVYQPDVVGVTALTPAYPSALRVAAIAKEECPECYTILGGPHANALPLEVIRNDSVDAVVIGEGEKTLEDLLDRVRTRAPLVGIPGAYTKPAGEISFGGPRPPVADLDELGWAARGAIHDERGRMKRDHYGLMMSSRGCPCHCHFCASPKLWSKKVRWRSPQDLVAEMVATYKQFDTRFFSFQDDTFAVNKRRAIEITGALRTSGLLEVPGFRWVCNTRPTCVDAELMDHLRAAGCAAVAVGIESASPRILQKMHKGFTAEDARRAVKAVKAAGMIATGQFMIGYPTETEAEMEQTARLAEELECGSVMLSVATPLPATELFEEAVELGLIQREGIDWLRVTTKADGALMTVVRDGRICAMPKEERLRILDKMQRWFDRIQQRTADEKNRSRMRYEAEYLPEDELAPVYGIRKTNEMVAPVADREKQENR